MKRALTVGVLLFSLAVCGAGAQELSVSYVEGDAQVRDGSAWAHLSIGDRLTPQSMIQLSQGACVEIRRADLRIVLSQKGIYSLSTIVAASRALGSVGVWKALSATLSNVVTGPARNLSSVGGARAADESIADDSEWMTSSAQVFLDAGKAYVKSGQYGEAIERFLQAFDAATEKESPQARYYLAYAHSLKGDMRAAIKYASDLQPSNGDEWAADFVIPKAKLYVDTYAFSQDISWLTQSGNDLAGDSARAAIYNFLLGVGYLGIGDITNAKANLSLVVTISGQSDLGIAAAQLLQGQ